MARARNKLTAKEAAAIKSPGRHSDGGGLYLHVSKTSETLRRRWIFRFAWQSKTCEMGLGPASTVSLARARELADAARRDVADGRNPVTAREATRNAQSAKPTFGEIADKLLAAKESEWRNPKHRAQWRMTLETYAAPLRPRPIDEIDTAAVLAVLTPLWREKPETGSRVRGRIEAVLDAAKAAGHRSGENPAAWRGHLKHLLPKRSKLSRGHHAAMAYVDVPGFIARLREIDSVAALALELTILTAARSGEALGARWSEIDLAAKVWTVPAERMKATREHRIPLSEPALAILKRLSEARTGELVFEGQRAGRPLSHNVMLNVMSRLGVDAVTVHGMRSAFRDWAGNETHFPREIAEAALAHSVGGAVEQAYRRGDALEKRRELMGAWAAWCEPKADNILKFKQSGGNSSA